MDGRRGRGSPGALAGIFARVARVPAGPHGRPVARGFEPAPRRGSRPSGLLASPELPGRRLEPGRLASSAFLAGALVAGFLGCGPRYDESTIKTPQQRMLEQEELAYKEELEARERKDEPGAAVEIDKPGAFDEQQAELELKRATLSAETCPDVVGDPKMPTGNTTVTLTFAHDGSVSEVTIPPPFEGTRLGTCVLNAYKGLFVPPYTGEDQVMSWEVTLDGPSD